MPIERFVGVARQIRTRSDTFARHERLRVYLAHGVVAACLVLGRFRPRIVDKIEVQWPSSVPNSPHDLKEAFIALTNWMEAHSFDGTVEWIVGVDYVRYLLLPWDERLSSISFCRTLAKVLFAQQSYGSDATSSASSVDICFAPLSYGHPLLAALIPKDIVQALASFSWRQRRCTTKITPALALVWDGFSDRFRKGAGVLALVEGGRLLRVDYERGNIVELSVRPFSEPQAQTALAGVNFIFPPIGSEAPGTEDLPIDGLLPDDDRRLAYALCGAT